MRKTHENSRRARREERKALGTRAERILAYLHDTGEALTDRELTAAMGFTDRMMVQPRVSDMLRDGLVVEVGSKICQQTGKRVRIVAAVSEDMLGDEE